MASSVDTPNLSVYVLGAGFSAPAGLPLGTALWREIYGRAMIMAADRSQRASKFRDDLQAFIEFKQQCHGIRLQPEEVIFEEFLGFLDIEHFLGLRGSETWSEAGNESQVIVKTLIGQVLSESLPRQVPTLYLEFARKLKPRDIILTFNYDTLLESAREAVGTPFRLVHERYAHVYPSGSGTLDTSKDEVIFLKLHGSIDWFDRKPYRLRVEDAQRQGFSAVKLTDPVFNSSRNWNLARLIDGVRPEDDPLSEIYRLGDLKEFYKHPPWFLSTPILLSPSISKIVYAQKFKDLWWGLGYLGTTNLRMVIIGYSLPEHDDYALQAIFRIVKNYQDKERDLSFTSKNPEPITFVDRLGDDAERENYKRRYSFVDWNDARTFFGGFDLQVIISL